MTVHQKIIAYHQKNPEASPKEIAAIIGCHPAYVRTVFYRAGMTVPKTKRLRKRRRLEKQMAVLKASHAKAVKAAFIHGCKVAGIVELPDDAAIEEAWNNSKAAALLQNL